MIVIGSDILSCSSYFFLTSPRDRIFKKINNEVLVWDGVWGDEVPMVDLGDENNNLPGVNYAVRPRYWVVFFIISMALITSAAKVTSASMGLEYVKNN